MPERGFRTITVTEQLYQQVSERAKKENKKTATYASEILETMLYVEDKFRNYVPFLELVSLNDNEVIIRDSTDYCPHTAFAAALPQVRNALKH